MQLLNNLNIFSVFKQPCLSVSSVLTYAEYGWKKGKGNHGLFFFANKRGYQITAERD